jgi:hypothetical protein
MAQEQLDRIRPWFSIIMILPSGQGPLKEIHMTLIFSLLVNAFEEENFQPEDFLLSIVHILR